MSTLRESVRVQAVIVLAGILFLSSSHAQVLMSLSQSETALPQAFLARYLDPVNMLPIPPEANSLDGLLTVDAHSGPLADVLELAEPLEAVAGQTGPTFDILRPPGLERIREHTAQAADDGLLLRCLHGSTFDFVIAGFVESVVWISATKLAPAAKLVGGHVGRRNLSGI